MGYTGSLYSREYGIYHMQEVGVEGVEVWGVLGILQYILQKRTTNPKACVSMPLEKLGSDLSLVDRYLYLQHFFSKLSRGCYGRAERQAVLSHAHRSIMPLVNSVHIFTYTKATQTRLTWQL